MNLIPAPVFARQTVGAAFTIDDSTTIGSTHSELRPLIDQFVNDVAAQSGIFLQYSESQSTITLELVTSDSELDELPMPGGVRADGGDAAVEAYGLVIDHNRVRVRATAAEGIFRGLTSLRQAIGIGRTVPTGRILDAPRFAWRGFLLDTARTFWSVAMVQEIIDLLAIYKFNVLHLHLTDSQGWRIEIDSRPDLTAIGGQGAMDDRPGGYYTKVEFAELVDYAAARFITIVPEIDVPGHAAAILKSCPELAGDGSAESAIDFRQRSEMLQFLHPGNPHLRGFLVDVLNEVASMTPSRWIHIGGDEPFGMPDELYEQFIELVRPIALATGKNLVLWQEAARAGTGPEDIAQYWFKYDPVMFSQPEGATAIEDIELPDRTPLTPDVVNALMEALSKAEGDVDKARAAGTHILISLSSKNYLDTPYGEASANPAQEDERSRLGMPFYPKSTVEEFLDWDPASIHSLMDESAIAGVEAAIWCETIREFDELMFLILPRLPGVAERAWSPHGVTTWEHYGPRLASQAPWWEQRGWNYFRSSCVDWTRSPAND